jgi:hypothetical protein
VKTLRETLRLPGVGLLAGRDGAIIMRNYLSLPCALALAASLSLSSGSCSSVSSAPVSSVDAAVADGARADSSSAELGVQGGAFRAYRFAIGDVRVYYAEAGEDTARPGEPKRTEMMLARGDTITTYIDSVRTVGVESWRPLIDARVDRYSDLILTKDSLLAHSSYAPSRVFDPDWTQARRLEWLSSINRFKAIDAEFWFYRTLIRAAIKLRTHSKQEPSRGV